MQFFVFLAFHHRNIKIDDKRPRLPSIQMIVGIYTLLYGSLNLAVIHSMPHYKYTA